MFFFFFNTTGEKSAKENIMTPFAGLWMATMVLLPVGLFLTYKAMHDSNLLNREYYFRTWRKVRSFIGLKN